MIGLSGLPPFVLVKAQAPEPYVPHHFPRTEIGPELRQKLQAATFRLDDRCTACLISPKGLLLTNRHCLDTGPMDEEAFLATNEQGERPLPGLHVHQQLHYEDVTPRILQGLRGDEPPRVRRSHIEQQKLRLLLQEKDDKYHYAEIRESLEGLRFYLIRWRVYRDIRLVLLPKPVGFDRDSSFFGWPRWSTDFALLRIHDTGGPSSAKAFSDFLPLGERLPAAGELLYGAGFPGYTDYHHTSQSLSELVLAPLQDRIRIDSTLLARVFLDEPNNTPLYHHLQQTLRENRQQYTALRDYPVIPWLQRREAQQLASSSSPAEAIRRFTRMNQAAQDLGELERASVYAEQSFAQLPVYQRAKVLTAILQIRPPGETFNAEYYAGKLPAILAQFPEHAAPQRGEMALLQEGLSLYFGHQKATYLSPLVIEQVTALEKNYELLAEIIHTESLLFKPQKARQLANEDLEMFIQALEEDVGIRFFRHLIHGHETRLYARRNQGEQAFRQARREYLAWLQQDSIPLPPDADGTLRLGQGTVPGDANGAVLHTRIDRTQAERLGDRRLRDVPNTFVNNLPFTGSATGSALVDAKGRLLGIHLERIGAGRASDYIYAPERQRNMALSASFIRAYLAGTEAGRRLLEEME